MWPNDYSVSGKKGSNVVESNFSFKGIVTTLFLVSPFNFLPPLPLLLFTGLFPPFLARFFQGLGS